jgi:hypothetical protein
MANTVTPFVDATEHMFTKQFKSILALGVFSWPFDSTFCVDNSTKSSGLRVGTTCEPNEDDVTGIALGAVGLDEGGEPEEGAGANIAISSIDVVAAGPGSLVADSFAGFDAPLRKNIVKGKSTVKLSNGGSAFKLSNMGLGDDVSTLVWEPTRSGDVLTIKCLRGTYIPVFPFPA